MFNLNQKKMFLGPKFMCQILTYRTCFTRQKCLMIVFQCFSWKKLLIIPYSSTDSPFVVDLPLCIILTLYQFSFCYCISKISFYPSLRVGSVTVQFIFTVCCLFYPISGWKDIIFSKCKPKCDCQIPRCHVFENSITSFLVAF